MIEKYRGKVGPADAMSALEPEFNAAYAAATKQMLDAVMGFEKFTGRIVDSIDLVQIDVTAIGDQVPKNIRHCAINFLPKPGEVAW